MLKITYYQNSSEILDLEFPNDLVVVCPNPSMTDRFRIMCQSKYQVVTIANWIGNVHSKNNLVKVGKAEMMLRLSSAWHNYFPGASDHLFYNAFEIFTELRSFTLQIDLINNILDEFGEDIKKSIQIFWAVMESLKLADEHLLYHLKGNEAAQCPVLFIGFKHLSAIQIEMLKKIADQKDVYFFISKEVKAEAHSTDWINWLDTEEIKKNDRAEFASQKTISVVYYPEKKLNLSLNEVLKKGKFQISFVGDTDGIFSFQEILLRDMQFKESVDLFQSAKRNIFSLLADKNFLTVNEVLNELELYKKDNLKLGNYLDLKIVTLIETALKIYLEYNQNFNSFVLGLLKTVVDLNTPRNFYIPLNQFGETSIVNFDEVKFINSENEQFIFLLTKEKTPFKSGHSKYPESVNSILRTLGPIRRTGLDVLFVKAELCDHLENKPAILFLEEEMLETDPGVRELSKRFKMEELDLKLNIEKKSFKDVFEKNIKHILSAKNNLEKTFSASKLQTYQDCPRKFFVNYIDKVEDSPKEKLGLAADEKGNLEHLIIEEYLTQYQSFDLSLLRKMCEQKLNHHIQANKIKISFDDFNEIFYELLEYTQNGINFILALKLQKPNAKVYFEFPLPPNEYNLKGFIDCIIVEDDKAEIYDFKRSQASIGSKKELLDFEKIQLWIYSVAVLPVYSVEKLGYINVSDTGSNVIINLAESQRDFRAHLNELITNYNNDNQFAPKPRNEHICDYCPINKICPKETI